jgi:hypothetical protein
VTERHPDSPRETSVDDELSDTTRPQMDELGRANLDEELGPDDLEDIGDDSSPGQNSDWLPQ